MSVVRPRVPEDLPALVDALLDQQAETRYPLRDPLPMPVEDFLHADDAVRAWAGEVDGVPVGHVCRVGPDRGGPEADALNDVCARAHGCTPADLAWVSALFVGTRARGLGLGRRLLQTVVDDIRHDGRHPCLEVLPVHSSAMALYAANGWRVVHRLRPAWLTATLGDEGPDVQVMVLLV